MSEDITSAEQSAAEAKANEVAGEILNLVEKTQSQGVFNLSEVIKGRGYPSKDATIYLDSSSAFMLAELNTEMSYSFNDDLLGMQEEKAAELAIKIKESAITFSMRGVSQKMVEETIKKTNSIYPPEAGRTEASDNPDWIKYYIASLVAQNIVKATDFFGNVDHHVYTTEEMLELRESVTPDSWNVLVETMQKLTLASGYFDQLTDAGFLPKS
jgi:hypothetical protein